MTVKISILLNLLLAWGLIFLWANRRSESVAPVTAPAVTLTAEPAKAATTWSAGPAPEPFRWSQLESPNNYRAYVGRLRAAGCPELSVRAIVTADVGDIFHRQRAQFNVDASEPGPWSRRSEERLIADLLEDQPEEAPAPVAEAKPQPYAPAASLPLVFQPVDLDALGLNDDEKAAVTNLQQQFLDQIGSQDPSDPGYLARWQQAQPQMDVSLRGMIGGQAFQNYQSAAYQSNTLPSQAE